LATPISVKSSNISKTKLTPAGLASCIDHTLLKPDATIADLKKICDEARQFQFATVCVNGSFVSAAAELLKGSVVKPIAVIGFPLGAMTTDAKVFETRDAIKNGAQEIDMVLAVGPLKAKQHGAVLADIQAVVKAAAPHPVKVILETGLLSQEEKALACTLAKTAGAAFVKTSTGFGPGGATVEDIRLMREIVGPELGVKASGGIRTYEDAIKMIEAGANRIGASQSVAIVTQAKQASDGGY
jgi:deoxyribose-phosphate aldolase